MKIYSVYVEGISTFFMSKREARAFNRKHDEPGEIVEWSKVEVVDLLNEEYEADRSALAAVGVISGEDARRFAEAMNRNEVEAGIRRSSSANGGVMTIYEALKARLGREPTGDELRAEVQRIKDAALVQSAEQGRLRHQRRGSKR